MTQENDYKDNFSRLRTRAEESLRTISVDEDDISQLSPAEIQGLIHELRVHQTELEMQNQELRQAQLQLEEQKDRYRDLYDLAPVGYMTLNEKGLILEANLTAVGLLGVERKSLTMMFLSSFVCKEFTDAFYLYLQRVFESQAKKTCDIKLKKKDGTLFHAQLASLAEQNESGQYSRCRVILTDVTERKQAEEQLRESEEKYRSLFNDSIDPIFITATDGTLIDANQSFFDLFGYTKEQILGTSVIKTYANPEDRFRFRQDIKKDGSVKDYPLRLIKRDGTEIDCLLTATVRKAGDGTILGHRGIVRDITERKQMEEELRHSEERHRTVVENSFDGIFVQKGPKIIFANSRLYEMLGYSPGELEGMDHWLVYHPDYQDINRQRTIAIMHGEGGASQYEVMLQRKDGSSFLVEISVRPVQVEGDPGIQAWIRDISGRRRSEEAQRRLAIAVEQAAEAIVIADARGSIQYVNPAFEQITGYSRDEAIGKNPRILQSGQHDQAFYRKLWDTITLGEAWVGQFVNKKKDGTVYREDATISPVRDVSGKIINYVAVKRDITREFQLQAQLVHAQKMEAVGTLAGGVAHDFNNLLQIVSGYSEILLVDKNPGDPEYDNLRRINATAKRGADLVQRLMTFSRKGDAKPRPLDFNHEVTQVKKLLERTIPKMIVIELSLEGELPVINADPVQVEQILMNLAINAKDAIPQEGGTLAIETKSVTLDEEYCSMHLEARPGRYVRLSVSDTGHGMGPETVQHIFEPFFTTKDVGKGTGLGLAMVYGIVKQHGGFISCNSEPGHGTIFQIYFPMVAAELEDHLELESADLPGGSETILLVDDEEFVCDMGSKLLTRAGYTVLTAAGGREAIDLYRKQGNDISLVILDLIMPEVGGKECFQQLMSINPKVKVILSSGFLSDGTTEDAKELGFRGFVEKPHNMRQLLGIVRQVLDGD